MSLHADEPIPSITTIYRNDQLCKAKEFTKSLELIVDRKVTYKNHHVNAISKRQKSWNAIQRKCSKGWGLTLNPGFLYKTVIQPQLIYASLFWAFSLEKAASETEWHSTQPVTACINELRLRRWFSPDSVAVLGVFRNIMPVCHSKSPLSLGNPYLANRKCSLYFGNTLLYAEFK